jgi:hypothetical protein
VLPGTRNWPRRGAALPAGRPPRRSACQWLAAEAVESARVR